MPYIVTEKREHLDPHIDALLSALRELESDDPTNVHCGNLNYVINRLMRSSYVLRYKELNEMIGVLECAKLELYRKMVGPYEDQKIHDHGDVV